MLLCFFFACKISAVPVLCRPVITLDNSDDLGPIHTIPDSSYIGLIPISDRPSIHTIPDESDMLRIAFVESNHSAVKVVCSGLLLISDHF